ncbi:unnamed protein product [Adineta steineri]|uniref:Uncharacterized protein n=1 Tax=Adineta steineri TaxID=433720 RepID=A0A813ZWK2_9BILA|nr:unnamed protein product [Adineta steineri]CAF0924252.1 unnamed protein product [Adineta steineri]CAF3694218.1 unnamed protein product [Adineta steineri]CAF3999332.1 unnamed protein product [Adineta steineri]
MLSQIHESSILSDLLTIIVTTSPVPSAPSSDLIQKILASLPSSLSKVPVIITFDNFTVASDESGRLKKGCIPLDLANRYSAYIENVQRLFGDVSCLSYDEESMISTSLDRNVTFLISKKRNGFAFNVKNALNYVKTPYIMILQHDWIFEFHPPIFDLLSILKNEDEIQYIGFIARMSLNYEISRGHTHPYYRHIFLQSRNIRLDRPFSNDLIACLHWFDRPHLCSVETYRQIFAMPLIKRGDFIEDTFGIEYMQSITNSLTKEAAFEKWKQWGAWMYYPDNGKTITVRHLHGRKNLLGEKQEQMIKNKIQSNMEKHTNLSREQNKILSEDFDENDITHDRMYLDEIYM